jgi:CxxC motif-containing protein (DUF1111 family)
MRLRTPSLTLLTAALLATNACDETTANAAADAGPAPDAGPAEGIFAALGEPLPVATPEQKATFERGHAVATRRFTPEDGLGPLFNVTFCAGCHEKPVVGGGAGRYRDFYIRGDATNDGGFIPGGERGGILAAYGVGDAPARPRPAASDDTFALRNPIPFFGVGLIAELGEASILANADPDDADGDGISGRPNYDRGFVGRFGVKSQTVSIEGFIRGPIFNHLGVTSDPLSPARQAALPVPSVAEERADEALLADESLPLERRGFAQAAAPGLPLTDDDAAPDPELSEDDLFDVVSFAMLLAAPQRDAPTEASERGRAAFAELACDACHVPALTGPRGTVPLYSDLLLHDMGDALADGIVMGLASGREFRTAPLWGVAATGPYLHDGRADTLDEAIRAHDGESKKSREAYEAATPAVQADVVEFLTSLGGRAQRTDGLLPPDAPVPAAGAPGGPETALDGAALDRFARGRALFDRDAAISGGLGPKFNGDSCRACHFDPVIGGAGPLDVNAMRTGKIGADGTFEAYPGGTGLAKLTTFGHVRPESEGNVFEPRQTPTALGLGVLDRIPEAAILENADPGDADGDGIAGVAQVLDDGRVGRFGWKAQVPSAREFVRDGMTNELGLTVPDEPGLTFGATTDDDAAPDPEIGTADLDDVAFYLTNLAPPAPEAGPESAPEAGAALFVQVQCDRCHIPALPGAETDVPAYTDLLLHRVGPDDVPGIVDGDAGQGHFRTPPLWGLRFSAPYMHDGRATTIEAAVRAHQGESEASRAAFDALPAADRALLLDFLATR